MSLTFIAIERNLFVANTFVMRFYLSIEAPNISK